jgi:hypothetical protein
MPLILVGLVLVMTAYSYDLLNHGWKTRHHLAHTIFGLSMVGYSLFYFYLLLISNVYIELKSNATFWWVAGTLLFFFPLSVINIFGTPLRKILLNGDDALYITYKVLVLVLYGSWTYAFICKKWEKEN